jgi:hypothetical protein
MFERWENRLYEMYYGRDCNCDSDEHCEGDGLTTPEGDKDEEHSCCQCREHEECDPHID